MRQPLTVYASATAGSSGRASFVFQSVPQGLAWTGTVSVFNAPAAAVLTARVGVPSAGQTWGSWQGNATFGPVQAYDRMCLVIDATGLTPNTFFQAVWIGESSYVYEATPVSPTALSTATIAGSGGFATISFVGASSGNTGAGTSSNVVNLTLPAGILAGDVIIAHVVKQPGADTLSFKINGVAKTFTSIRSDSASGSANNCRSDVLWYVCDGTESSLTLQVQFSGGADIGTMSAEVYRNVNNSTPVSTSTGTVTTSSQSNISTTSLTTVIANQWVLSMFSQVNSTGVANGFSTPGGVTNRQNNSGQGSSSLSDDDEILAVAGASTARNATLGAVGSLVAQAIALTPASA